MLKQKPSVSDLPSHTALQSHAISLSVLTFDLPPLEYTVDIEVSLTDSSFLEPIKEYFKNLNLPVSANISNAEMTVSDVNVTTGGLIIYFCILDDVLFLPVFDLSQFYHLSPVEISKTELSLLPTERPNKTEALAHNSMFCFLHPTAAL